MDRTAEKALQPDKGCRRRAGSRAYYGLNSPAGYIEPTSSSRMKGAGRGAMNGRRFDRRGGFGGGADPLEEEKKRVDGNGTGQIRGARRRVGQDHECGETAIVSIFYVPKTTTNRWTREKACLCAFVGELCSSVVGERAPVCHARLFGTLESWQRATAHASNPPSRPFVRLLTGESQRSRRRMYVDTYSYNTTVEKAGRCDLRPGTR